MDKEREYWKKIASPEMKKGLRDFYRVEKVSKNDPEKGRYSPDVNRKRSLERVRREDEKKKEVGSSRQALRSAKKVIAGPKWKAPIEALKLAHGFRKKVKEGDTSPFAMALVVAIIIDFADATWFIGLFLKPFLFYFLWGKGTLKVKITCRVLLFFDCIPFVSWLPLSSIAVLYAWKKAKKENEENKKVTSEAYG